MPDDSLNIHEAVQILKVNKLKANFASSQDGAKGTRFTFPTKMTENVQNKRNN